MDGAVVTCGGRRVEVQRLDGRETSLYPSIWLRDNCLCSDCFNTHSRSRLQLMSDLDPEIEVTDVTVSDGRLYVTWNDGHRSQYEHQWLVDRDFSDAAQATRRAMFSQPPVLWSAADMPSVNIPRMDFNKLTSDDSAFLQWLRGLENTGLNLLTDAPRDEGQIQRIGQRISFLKRSNYG